MTKNTKLLHCLLYDRAALPFIDNGEDTGEEDMAKLIDIPPDSHNLTVSHIPQKGFSCDD